MRRCLANLLRRMSDWLDPSVYERVPGIDLSPVDMSTLDMPRPVHIMADMPEYGSNGPHCVDHVDEFGVYL